MKHGRQELVGSWTITHLDPILSLGPLTKVEEMYRAEHQIWVKQLTSTVIALVLFIVAFYAIGFWVMWTFIFRPWHRDLEQRRRELAERERALRLRQMNLIRRAFVAAKRAERMRINWGQF